MSEKRRGRTEFPIVAYIVAYAAGQIAVAPELRRDDVLADLDALPSEVVIGLYAHEFLRVSKAEFLLAFSVLLSDFLMPMVQVFPNGILEDDGYFYAQIAYNVATLGASTFDDNIERLGGLEFFLISSLMMETILLSALLLIISSRILDRDRNFAKPRSIG